MTTAKERIDTAAKALKNVIVEGDFSGDSLEEMLPKLKSGLTSQLKVKPKLKRFKVWKSVTTAAFQHVEAETQEAAIEKADELNDWFLDTEHGLDVSDTVLSVEELN